jgi:hypothetical protein
MDFVNNIESIEKTITKYLRGKVIRIEKIYDMLQNNLSDFTEFHDYIQDYITE